MVGQLIKGIYTKNQDQFSSLIINASEASLILGSSFSNAEVKDGFLMMRSTLVRNASSFR